MSLAERVAVVLVEPLYEENIGYVARVMKNFGVKRLIIVKPRCKIGLEAIKRSMHARDVLEGARLVDSFEEVIREFDLVIGTTGKHGKKFTQVRRFMTPERLAKRLAEYRGTVAIVFGREDRGLTNAELALCDGVVTIPANPEYPILNLSHAVAVILYEVFKACGSKPELPRPSMPRREEVDVLLKYLYSLVLTLWGSERRAEKAVLMMKRMFSSCLIGAEDVRMLLGVFRESYERLAERRRE